jgi:mRNA interferase RelE/StbE
MSSKEQFSTEQLVSVRSALDQFEQDKLEFHHPAILVHSLTGIWGMEEPLPRDLEADRYVREAPAGQRLYKAPRAVPKAPDWDLGLSSEFRKAIRGIDRKLQGRVLQAIDYISTKPTVPKGDTVKPLGGELKGLWRYRIGDYRLVYRPDPDNGRVVLVTFVGRGAAYA